jgi:hypothetical protein
MTEHDQDRRLERTIADWFARETPVHAPPTLLEGVFARTERRRRPWSRLSDMLLGRGRQIGEFAIALVVIAAFALAVSRSGVTTSVGSPSPTGVPAMAVAQRIDACGREPLALSEAQGSLWVTCRDGARRVDPATGSVGTLLAGVTSVASGAGGTWAAVPGGIAPLDPATGALGPTVGIGPIGAIVVADDVVWALRADTGRLVLVDPQGRVIGDVDAGTRIADMVLDEDEVWTLSEGVHEVRAFDASTGAERARVSVGDTATRLAGGPGAVWVVDPRAGAVLRIDAATNAVTTLTLLPGDPGGLTDLLARSDALYIGERFDLVRRDPATGHELARLTIAGYPSELVGLGDDVWVLAGDGGLSRVTTTGR